MKHLKDATKRMEALVARGQSLKCRTLELISFMGYLTNNGDLKNAALIEEDINTNLAKMEAITEQLKRLHSEVETHH